MPHQAWPSVLSLVLLLAQVPLRVSAADAEAALNSPEYKELVREALEQYTLGHWTEARVFFGKAHALAPNARTLRGLALVCYESRLYVEAIAYAGQSLANPIAPLNPQMSAELQQLAAQARSFVTHARISLTPATAELRLDGKGVAREPDGAILLDPGSHELVASAPGYESYTQQLRAEGGDELRFDIALRSNGSGAGATERQAGTARGGAGDERSTLATVGPWLVVGASAAVAIAGGVLFAFGESDRATVRNAKSPTTWPEIEGAYDRAPTLLTMGGVLFGVGVAGFAGGLAWKLWLQPQDERVAGPNVRFTPTGMQVSGTF